MGWRDLIGSVPACSADYEPPLVIEHNIDRIKDLFWISGSHRGNYEELCPVGYNTLWSSEIQPMFRRNIWPSSQRGSLSETRNKYEAGTSKSEMSVEFHRTIMPSFYFTLVFLCGLLFHYEDGGDIFLRNVGWRTLDYIAL
jgi:hypothetical protein